jgi:type IV fimbrial biogenesis protein FimT
MNLEYEMVKAPPQYSGFTIIELMIVLAIAAILAAIAAPSFRETIQNNRLVTQVNELQASLGLARSEAIKLNNNVIVCSINTATNKCGANWANGWNVFVDTDADGDFTAGENILRVHGAISGGNTLTYDQSTMSYTGTGLSRTNIISTFTFCDDRDEASAKGVIINTTGRAGLATIDSDADGIVEDGDSDELDCS